MPSKRPAQIALAKKARRRFHGYPVATVAYYGPTDRVATKVAVGIVDAKENMVALERWFSDSGDIRHDENVTQQIVDFIERHKAQSVGMPDGILGCPHEEGIDYPKGESCPQCPFWANKDRWAGKHLR